MKRPILLKRKDILSISDLNGLATVALLDIGIRDCLKITADSKNRKAYASILEGLDKGESIAEVLKKHLPSSVLNYYEALIPHLTFARALSLSLKLQANDQKIRDAFIKKLSYPLLLLSVCVIGLYVFNNYFYGSLMLMIKDLGVVSLSLDVFKIVTDIVLNILLLSGLFVLVIFLLLLNDKYRIISYHYLCHHFKDNLYTKYISGRFVTFFSLSQANGLSTKDTISSLRKLKSDPLLSFIAYRLDQGLERGEDFLSVFNTPYLDSRLNHYLNIAYHSLSGQQLYDNYLAINALDIDRIIKISTLSIQSMVYLFVIMTVFFIYRIILSPLSAIANL